MTRWLMAMGAALLVSASAGPAQAAPLPNTPGTVTLSALPATVDYGGSIDLTGGIAPAAAGEHVLIMNTQGDTLATADTDAAGGFVTTFQPDHNMTIHAEWGADSSAPVDVGVRAVVTVKLSNVRLFGKALVTGTVAPAGGGANADIDLTADGKVVAQAHPSVAPSGDFKARFAIDEPGKYVAQASFSDATHLTGTATSKIEETPLPSLHPGSDGETVLLLEKRLLELGYHFFGINERYDERTGDAVMAFRKVQGMTRTDTVNTSVWRALADPRVPEPKDATKLIHLEVDQSRQVLFVVEDNEVKWILHVSTGKPSTPTPNGNFHVYRKYNGYNGLWWPSFIYNGVAIHGWPQVPTYNASHGCVRVPIWHAKWIFGVAKIGTRVFIYQ